MPFKDRDGTDLATCSVGDVYKVWKEEASVRMVAVRADRLFEPSAAKTPTDQPRGIRMNIRDTVHNMYVLKPLLERMVEHTHHPVPYVKDLAREKLIWNWETRVYI